MHQNCTKFPADNLLGEEQSNSETLVKDLPLLLGSKQGSQKSIKTLTGLVIPST